MNKLRRLISLLGVGVLLLVPVLVSRNLAQPAGASATAPPPIPVPREIVSPFAPMGARANSDVLIADVRLAGTRVSSDPSRSGAVFMLADGAERAFVIGQEVKPGLRLTTVAADRVVLSSEFGLATLQLQGAAPRLPSAPIAIAPPERSAPTNAP